jgi:hypothetical protein
MIAVQLHLSPAHNMIEQVLPVENADETSFTKKPKHGIRDKARNVCSAGIWQWDERL